MKTVIFAALFSTLSLYSAATDPNEKVLTAFTTVFSNVKNVSWSENEYTYEVKFVQDEVSARITYDKKGNILSSLRYYGEQRLPFLVLRKIKEKYGTQKIYGVVEQSSDEGTYYHVTLEDEKTWTNIVVDASGFISQKEKFNKA